MKRLNFFGLGNDAEPGSRTNFRFQIRSSAPWPPSTLRQAWPWEVVSNRSGRSVVGPRLGAEYRAALHRQSTPRVSTTQPRFARYQSFVQATVPADTGWRLNQGGTYRVTYDVFDDRERGRFDFRRLEVEGRHKFADAAPLSQLDASRLALDRRRRARETTFPSFFNTRSAEAAISGAWTRPRSAPTGVGATLRGFRSLPVSRSPPAASPGRVPLGCLGPAGGDRLRGRGQRWPAGEPTS